MDVIMTNITADDKPVVVVTHGDCLSMLQRAHVQNELAEVFGIPVRQIFDIPGITLLVSCFKLLVCSIMMYYI